ncbi:MAG: Ig-like domain-containing protein, partial [Acidobacteriota bacterium]
MTVRANSTERTRMLRGARRRQSSSGGSCDLRQFIAAVLAVSLTFPASLSPHLFAASGPGSGSAVQRQRATAGGQPAGAGDQPISDAALSRQAPTLNGGVIEGSLRVFEGKNFDLGSKFGMTGDLFVVGTPDIELQQGASFGGTVDEGGAADPSYKIRLRKDVNLPGKIHIRTDPLPLPDDIPGSAPAPAGNRKVNIDKAGDVSGIGNWGTVRDLTLNAPGVSLEVPPGNYGQFTINGPAVLRFSGGDYSFASGLSLHQESSIEVAGPASIILGSSFGSNGGKIRVVSGIKPHQLRFNVLGNTLNLSGDTVVEALVRAPQAHATLNGDHVVVRGQLIVDRLTMNAGKIIGDMVPTDTTPPIVQIVSPDNNTAVYNSKIAVRGLARDEGEIRTGVTSVTVNGAPADFDASDGSWLVTVPLALGDNLITARASDAATPPNTGIAEIHVLRKHPGPPSLSVTYPADDAFVAADLVTVAGRVTSDSPEVALNVTVNGQPAILAGSEFACSIRLVDGPNPITVIAGDSLGQTSQLTLSVTCDLTPPQVALVSVPAVVLPGSSYRIAAEAADNHRLASVEFSIDGQKQADVQAPPFEFTYVVPAAFEPGRRIGIAALARDASGRVGIDSDETRVAGPGGVAGRVFDDQTGYALPGVAVASSDGGAAQSAADGEWFFVSPLSVGVARFSKAGYTACERDFSLEAGRGAWLLDARLTPLDGQSNEIGPAGGQAAGDSGRLQATVASGTLDLPLDVRLTAVSPQGLIGVLPYSWSPVPGAVVDFRPVNSPQPVSDSLRFPVRLVISSLPQALDEITPSFVFYDESSHHWIVVAPQVAAGPDGTLTADLERFGQYAFVVPDLGSTAPPLLVAGQALAGSPAVAFSALSSATAFATATPPVALYGPEAQSTIRVTVETTTKIPSGVWSEASFDERYELRGQSEPKMLERPGQTIVLYSYPAATSSEPNRLGAFFVAKPTLVDYSLAEFRAANLKVRIRSATPEPGMLVDSGGATISAAGGLQLELPAGALADATPVFVKSLSSYETALQLPDGYEVLGGAQIDLSGATLAESARLSLPAFSSETARTVIARIITAGDRRAPKLVARAVEVNGRLESSVSPPAVPSGLLMPGITEGGTYAFIRFPAPFGYATGTVKRAASGSEAAGVRVSADTNPFVDLTSTNGRYLLPGIAGPDFEGLNNLSAASLGSDETGNSSAALVSQDAVAENEIVIGSVPLSVASVTPLAGATGIPVSTTIRVTFTKPITPASLTASSFRISAGGGKPVAGTVVVLAGNQAAVFTPLSGLVPATTYRIDLSTTVLDLYGHALAAAFTSTFTTAAVQPVTGRLTAGNVAISYPDSGGFVTINIPAGLVPSGSIVIAINRTLGSTSTVTAGAGPLSIRLMARLGDDIRIIVRQPSGVDYEVAQAAYRSPDGFGAVGPSGGTVVSADGSILLVIEPGAIAGLAEIRLSPAPESSITIPRLPGTPMDPSNVVFGAGVKIETRGTFNVEKELHIEAAAPAGVTEGRRAICLSPSRAIDPDTGEEVDVWDSITSAVVEQGRFKTTSLPFIGLQGVYDVFFIYMFMPRFSHILWGWAKEENKCRAGASESQGSYLPVAGVLCVSAAAGPPLRGQVTARTNQDGRYAMFDVSMAPPTNIVLFIDELNHRRVSSGAGFAGFGPQESELIHFLGGLQGFTYANVDALLPCPSFPGGSAPVLVISGRQVNLAPGQVDPLPSQGVARFGGLVEIMVASDQRLAPMEGRVRVGGASPRQLNWQTLTPDCTAECRYSTLIEATAEGGYLVQVTGYGPGGVGSAAYQFVVLRDPNFRPPLEGPPFVLSVSPKDEASDVDILTEIRIEFSEPVTNLVGNGTEPTVFLEGPDGSKLGGTIFSGGIVVLPETSVSSIVFKPEGGLVGGTTYVLHVTVDVVDSNQIRLHHGPETAPGEFTSRFSTYGGAVLSAIPEAQGLRVAVDGRYAFVLQLVGPFSSELLAYDAVDPHNPVLVGKAQLPQYTTDLAVSSQTQYLVGETLVSRIGLVTAFYPLSPDRAANLWIFNLDNPEGVSGSSPIGVVSLYFPQDLSTVPLTVAVHKGRAYVGSAPYRGMQVIDIQEAIRLYEGSTASAESPVYLALAPYHGFGQEAVVQSLLYHNNDPKVPAMANSVSVITQNVAGDDSTLAGVMPVAFAVDGGARAVLAAGFPSALDGVFGYLGEGPFGDRRILSWVSIEGAYPLAVQAASGVRVGTDLKDIAVVLTSEDLLVYDATSHPMTLLGTASRAELKIDGPTNRFTMEDGLAYFSSAGGLSVIDLSKAGTPRLVTVVPGPWSGSTSISVSDGFVHNVSAASGYAIGIARPVAQVFVHGLLGASGRLCSNPVILDRNNPNHPMLHPAEVLFQVFGKRTPMERARVIIRKGEEIQAALEVSLQKSATYDLMTGAATWQSDQIDLAASYTAQVLIEDYETEREPIPMSYLVSDHQTTIQVQPKGLLVEDVEVPPYSYVLAANATVTITVGSGPRQRRLTGSRSFGLNSEKLNIGGLEVGRYELRLHAQMPDGYSEEMVGVLEIVSNPNDVRVPNHTVVGGIDLATGQLGLTYTDVSIKGRGLSLEFTRSYNQAAANVLSPLGYGWHHNYQMLLVHNKELRLYTIIGGDAQGETFPAPDYLEENPKAAGSMRSLSPFHTTLVRNTDGSFDYFNKAHIRYHFPGALERDSYGYYRQAYLGNLDYIADGYNNRIDLKYDTLGRLVSVVDPSQRALSFEYEEALAPFVGVVLPFMAGHSSATCLADGRFSAIRDHFATSTAGKAWRIMRITGPGGLEITYEYDLDGNLARARRSGAKFSIPGEEGRPGVESQGAEDYTWTYLYKPARSGAVPAENLTHLLRQIISPNQAETVYEFDQNNAALPISTVRYPEGVVNSFAYTFDGVIVQKVEVTDGKGIPTTYTLHREKVVGITVAGAHTSFEYDDEKGLKLQETDPGGMVRRYFYDENGNVTRLEQIGSGEGQETRILSRAVFDGTFNRPVNRWDANSQQWNAVSQRWDENDKGLTTYKLNHAGDIQSVRFPDGSSTSFEYDSFGQLTKVTDRLGLVTEYTNYDVFGNVGTITQETERDAAGNVKTIVTENHWDALSRLVSTSSTLGPTLTYSYDKLDRVVQTLVVDPSETRTPLSVTYQYRIGGQLEKEVKETTTRTPEGGVVPQTHTISYAFDWLDRRTAIEEIISGGPTYVRSFEYDANSNLVFETNRRGIGSRYTYNELNFLEKHEIFERQADGAWVLKAVEADPTPDLVGNPISVIDRYGNSTTLRYDGLHRLTGRATGGYAEGWELDGNGNITTFRDRNGRLTRFEYDGLNRVTLRRDPAGRETRWNYQLTGGHSVTTMSQPHRGLTVTTWRDALDRPLVEEILCSGCANSPYRTEWTYSDSERKIEIRDPRGNTTTKRLSAFGETASIQLGRDQTIKKYTGLGGLYSLTNGRGKQWAYELDGLNRVIRTRHPEVDGTRAPPVPIEERFAYDGEGNLQSHANRRNVSTTQTYDHLGRVLTRTVGAFPVDQFSYNDSEHTVTRTDANSHSTVFRYDPLGRLTAVTNARGDTKGFQWDGVNLRGETDFRGKLTAYEYDEVDRLCRVTDRLGRPSNIRNEDNNGLVRTTTDRRGNQRVEVFDGLDRLVSVHWGGAPFARYQYDGNDNLTRQTDGEGRWIAYLYSVENWVEAADHGGLRRETFGYDEVGNLRTYFDGAGGAVEQIFDGLDRVVSRKDGLGNETRFSYDGELLRLKTDPRGHETRYEYNELGSLVQVNDALQNTWNYRYDPVQNLIEVRDPLDVGGNRATAFVPDELNRIQMVRSSLARERGFAYDPNSNLVLRTDPKGQVRATIYDDLDQPEVTTFSLGAQQPLKWEYQFDPEGNLFSLRETAGEATATPRSYQRSYDARNRLTSTIDPFGHTVSLTYDNADNVSTFADASGRTTEYGYDGANRLSSVTLPGAQTVGLSWRADNLVEEVRYPGGMLRQYVYDDADRMTGLRNQISATESEELGYGYDADSNRKTEIRKVNGQVSRELSYKYDALERLIQATYGGTSVIDYTYDAVGNRKTESGQTPSGQQVNRNYTVNEANELTAVTDLMDPARSLTLTYDPNGNLATEQSMTAARRFEHDVADRLSQVSDDGAGLQGSYDYDFQGRRISRTTAAGSTQYVYRGDGLQVANEFDRRGRVTGSYDFASDLIRADLAEGQRWYFHDALGSTTSLASLEMTAGDPPLLQGTRRAGHEYDAWGLLIPPPPISQPSSPSANRVLYTGYRRDDETGLDYALARYYDPRFGRFLQQDPLPD